MPAPPPSPYAYRPPPTVGRPGYDPYVVPLPGYETPVPPQRPAPPLPPLYPSPSQHLLNQFPGMTEQQLRAAIQKLNRNYFYGGFPFPGELAPPLSGQQWGPSNWTLLLHSFLNPSPGGWAPLGPSAHLGWSSTPDRTGMGASLPNWIPYPRPRTRT